MRKFVAAALAVSLLAGPARAELRFEAVPQAGDSVVEWLGSPQIIRKGERGSVSVTPRGVERGRFAFDVEVQNLDAASAFFGRENIFVRTDGGELGIAPSEQAKQASERSAWSQIGIALATVALVGIAAAVAGGGAAGAGHTYFYTPSERKERQAAPAGVLSATAAAPLKAGSVPGRSLYRGRILVDRPRGSDRSQELSLLVDFHGEQYPFTFRMSRG